MPLRYWPMAVTTAIGPGIERSTRQGFILQRGRWPSSSGSSSARAPTTSSTTGCGAVGCEIGRDFVCGWAAAVASVVRNSALRMAARRRRDRHARGARAVTLLELGRYLPAERGSMLTRLRRLCSLQVPAILQGKFRPEAWIATLHVLHWRRRSHKRHQSLTRTEATEPLLAPVTHSPHCITTSAGYRHWSRRRRPSSQSTNTSARARCST